MNIIIYYYNNIIIKNTPIYKYKVNSILSLFKFG